MSAIFQTNFFIVCFNVCVFVPCPFLSKWYNKNIIAFESIFTTLLTKYFRNIPSLYFRDIHIYGKISRHLKESNLQYDFPSVALCIQLERQAGEVTAPRQLAVIIRYCKSAKTIISQCYYVSNYLNRIELGGYRADNQTTSVRTILFHY